MPPESEVGYQSNDGMLACINHPNTPTALRCNRCGQPICARCAQRTPVGYRCKTCVKDQQAVFFSATPTDYLVAALVSIPLSLAATVAAGFVAQIGFFALWILLPGSPAAGIAVADLVHRAIGRRRGRYIWLVVCSVFTLVVLAGVFVAFLRANTFALGLIGVFGFLAVGATFSRLKFGK